MTKLDELEARIRQMSGRRDAGMRRCPRCQRLYSGYPALSREDNETEICPRCGAEEAIEDYLGLERGHTLTDRERELWERRKENGHDRAGS